LVTSRQNPLVKLVRRLRLRKHRDESGLFICEGARVVDELLKSGWPIQHVVVTPRTDRAFAERARARGAEVTLIEDELADYLAEADSSQGVLAVAQRKHLPLPARPALLVIADRIADPGNLGAIIRTAGAFGCAGVVLLGTCADPFGPKTVRASAGSLFHLSVIQCSADEELLTLTASLDVRIAVAVARDGVAPWEADLRDAFAFVFGHETRGVSPSLVAAADLRLTIPLHPRAESLNVATAAAVLLAEAARQRTKSTEPRSEPRT